MPRERDENKYPPQDTGKSQWRAILTETYFKQKRGKDKRMHMCQEKSEGDGMFREGNVRRR